MWCCSSDSVTTADATATLVVEALREWRGWPEDLAERFADLAIRREHPCDFDGPLVLGAGCTRLVTAVADRTRAESGWYGHCIQVLRRLLAYSGIDEGQAQAIVGKAVGGRFGAVRRLKPSHRTPVGQFPVGRLRTGSLPPKVAAAGASNPLSVCGQCVRPAALPMLSGQNAKCSAVTRRASRAPAGGASTLRCSVENPTATTRAPNRCSQSQTTVENFAVSLS